MTRTKEQRPTTSFDLERARDVEKAMSPLPCFVIEDAHGDMIIIRNPNHPIHIDNLAARGKRDEANTPDAIGITYMRENFSNLIAEIERLRPYEKVAADLAACGSYVGIGPGEGELPIPERVRRCVNRLKETQHEYEQKIISKDARIKELEDAHKRSGKKYAKIINELRSSVYANIPGLDVGKIGPDAETGNRDHVVGPDQMVPNGKVWQITEERVGLLEYCLETLLDAPDIEEIPGPGHSIEMLRTMLREARP